MILQNNNSIQEIRKKLRSATLAARNKLSKEKWQENSRNAQNILKNIDEFQQARSLFFYINYKSELETIPLIEKEINKGREISVPLTLPDEGLEAYKISDLENQLSPGFCNIPEPIRQRSKKIDPATIDIVILPGSVFDVNGGRLGYGGGYYDRFLVNSAPQAVKIGLAFELQVVDKVPVMPHDQPLDFLVTEKRVIRVNG